MCINLTSFIKMTSATLISVCTLHLANYHQASTASVLQLLAAISLLLHTAIIITCFYRLLLAPDHIRVYVSAFMNAIPSSCILPLNLNIRYFALSDFLKWFSSPIGHGHILLPHVCLCSIAAAGVILQLYGYATVAAAACLILKCADHEPVAYSGKATTGSFVESLSIFKLYYSTKLRLRFK